MQVFTADGDKKKKKGGKAERTVQVLGHCVQDVSKAYSPQRVTVRPTWHNVEGNQADSTNICCAEEG